MDYRWYEIIRGQRSAEEGDIERWADQERTRERREIEEAAAAKIEGASSLVERAIRLMARADYSWTTVSGAVRSWGDEDVLDVGRELFHQERGEPDGGQDDDTAELCDEDEEDELGRWETESTFLAAQPPFRLRLERVWETGFAENGSSPGLLILNGRAYWAVFHDHVESGRIGPERGIHIRVTRQSWRAYEDGVERGTASDTVDYGVENLNRLLRPARLLRAFDFQSATEKVEAGRDALQLSATLEPTRESMSFGRELIALGPATYTITIDATCGIVLAWMATLNGMPAKGQSLSDVEIDRPIDESVFAGPT